MAQKKAAFIMLLTLIMIFISLVLSWMAYSQKGGGGEEYPQLEKRTAELEQQVEELTASRNQMLAMLDQGGTEKNPEENPNPQPGTEQPASQGEKMFTVTSKVYLRADATINAWIVDELPKGKKLIYLNEKKEADGFTWYKVSDSYKIWGWVSSSHVQ